LFCKAIMSLDKIARQTHDLSLFTDGERRYGTLLFEICHELVHNGKPGRPKKTFKKGVHVRLKNKGAQGHKKGRKRPKYQSPWREHPETARPIAETDIHANHAEAFFSALRRKCATFRRKTNTYAKATKGLQRLLHVYWVVHYADRPTAPLELRYRVDHAQVQRDAELDGVYLLVAGGKAATLSDAEIAAEWKGQYKVEHCFRLVHQ